MGKLDGRVAIITGGASGIGAASVRRFVEEGAQVVLADIQDERGQALADELGPAASYLHTDVTQEADVKAAVDLAVSRFGRLDCLFNNAGGPGAPGAIDEMSVEAFDHTVAVLLRSVFLGIKHAAPVMKAQRSGSIVSTASIAGLGSGYAGHAYSAAKAGVINLTRSVSAELREWGIRVNCICPGFIATPIFARAMGWPHDADEDAVTTLLSMGAATPDEIANAALWLASDDSRYVNGHALVVDNGLTTGAPPSVRRDLAARLQASRTPTASAESR